MNNTELVFAVTTLAVAIAEKANKDDLTMMSLIFTQLGDTLATLAEDGEQAPPNASSK